MKKVCLSFVLLLHCMCAQANEALVEKAITGSQVRSIQSKIVDQEYQLLIKTPEGYENSLKTYPVIYFLDAQWDFPLMISTYGQSYYDGFIPEAILVGIQWGGHRPDPNVLRARDFTPSHMKDVANSGGAPKFLQFIKQELIPYIGNEYRANDNRVLMGSSYGGLFTLYALFKEPNLFNGYIPSASASGWDNDILYSYAKEFSDKKLSRPIRLYSAIGEYDSLMPAFDKLVTFFKQNTFSGVSTRFERLTNLGHASVKGAANTWGLHYVFAKPTLALNKEQMTPLLGLYRGSKSHALAHVLLEHGQLLIQIGEIRHPVLASSQFDFYQQGEFFQATFDAVARPPKIKIETFLGSEEFLGVE